MSTARNPKVVDLPRRGTAAGRDARIDAGVTTRIVESVTNAIIERRLMPGTKLAEQKGDAVGTGPTLTNVNDFRAILVAAPGTAGG